MRRPRLLRDLGDVALAVLWAILAFGFINSFGDYTEVGDLAILLGSMAFAAWAWWYGEDRDRRRRLAERDGD